MKSQVNANSLKLLLSTTLDQHVHLVFAEPDGNKSALSHSSSYDDIKEQSRLEVIHHTNILDGLFISVASELIGQGIHFSLDAEGGTQQTYLNGHDWVNIFCNFSLNSDDGVVRLNRYRDVHLGWGPYCQSGNGGSLGFETVPRMTPITGHGLFDTSELVSKLSSEFNDSLKSRFKNHTYGLLHHGQNTLLVHYYEKRTDIIPYQDLKDSDHYTKEILKRYRWIKQVKKGVTPNIQKSLTRSANNIKDLLNQNG